MNKRIIVRQKLDEPGMYRVIIRGYGMQKIYVWPGECVDELYSRWRNGKRFRGYDWDRW